MKTKCYCTFVNIAVLLNKIVRNTLLFNPLLNFVHNAINRRQIMQLIAITNFYHCPALINILTILKLGTSLDCQKIITVTKHNKNIIFGITEHIKQHSYNIKSSCSWCAEIKKTVIVIINRCQCFWTWFLTLWLQNLLLDSNVKSLIWKYNKWYTSHCG